MQGRLMPAIRRTPPGEEAQEQDNALHKVGTLAYFLPIAFAAPALWLVSALIALASRAALFDFVLNRAARRPAFEVGQTAFIDKWLRKISPTHPERLSAAARLLATLLLGGAALVVASRANL
jgi:hypothetical protein